MLEACSAQISTQMDSSIDTLRRDLIKVFRLTSDAHSKELQLLQATLKHVETQVKANTLSLEMIQENEQRNSNRWMTG